MQKVTWKSTLDLLCTYQYNTYRWDDHECAIVFRLMYTTVVLVPNNGSRLITRTRGALRKVLISCQVNHCSRRVHTYIMYTFCGSTLAMIETKMAESQRYVACKKWLHADIQREKQTDTTEYMISRRSTAGSMIMTYVLLCLFYDNRSTLGPPKKRPPFYFSNNSVKINLIWFDLIWS